MACISHTGFLRVPDPEHYDLKKGWRNATFVLALLFVGIPLSALADTGAGGVGAGGVGAGGVGAGFRFGALLIFAAVVTFGLIVATLARRRVRSPADFYAAGGGMGAFHNGLALAGDYLSAASFLGVAGLISLWGYDGLMFPVGWLVAYLSVMLLIAEPCRNIGTFTPADILASRSDPRLARIAGAVSSIGLSLLYLTAQMVGGGMLIHALVGIDYEIAVLAVGALVIAYVLLGGMVAATWVQIIKAGSLVLISFVMVLMVWAQYGMFGSFLDNLIGHPNIQSRVATLLGDISGQLTPEELGRRFLAPGLLHNNPLDQLSLGLALIFGAAGLPHILMRFFTVSGVTAVRYSLLWAMVIIAAFYLLAFYLGAGALMRVGGPEIVLLDAGGNMALPLLAQSLAGGSRSLLGNLMLALVAAVAFVMIVAVMASLLLAAASSIGHDLYAVLWRRGRAEGGAEIAVNRWATLGIGLLAILLGILAKGQNVAALVALAFALAASTNFPAIFLTLHWRLCTTAGVVGGMLVGGVTAIGLILISPNMSYPQKIKADAALVLSSEMVHRQFIADGLANPDRAVQERARHEALGLDRSLRQAKTDLERYRDDQTSLIGLVEPAISLRNPGLWSIPLGFLATILISLVTTDPRARIRWNEMHVRQHVGPL